MRPTLRRFAPAVAFVAALASAACGSGSSGDSGDGGELAAAMCEAAAKARAGDRDAAVAAFEDRHAGLHAYADRLAENDRQLAGEVLRAKQEVEAGIEGDGSGELAEALRDLAAALAGGAEPCG